MKLVSLFLVLTGTGLALSGCDSGHDAKLREAQRQFAETAQGVLDAEQWKLDDATASTLFDDGTERYLTFRKCHEEPPVKEANKQTCAALQKRVATAEAANHAKEAKERANW